jgi:ADP-ribose pyrophosphatase YjhB (NUDIX family)
MRKPWQSWGNFVGDCGQSRVVAHNAAKHQKSVGRDTNIPRRMKYCSRCAALVFLQASAVDEVERYVCSACGTTHYENPRTIVASIVLWQQKLLMCRRAEDPAQGQWVLPSGFLECGETLQQGAAREALEETGVIVDPAALELYSVVNMPAIRQIIIAFRISIEAEPTLLCGPECLEVKFIGASDVHEHELAWRQSMGNSVERLFQEVQIGQFAIHLVTLGSETGDGFITKEYVIASQQ